MFEVSIRKTASRCSILIVISQLLIQSLLPAFCATDNSLTTVENNSVYVDISAPSMPNKTNSEVRVEIKAPTLKNGNAVPIGEKIKIHIEPSFKIAGSYSRLFQKYSGATSASEFVTDILLYLTLKKIFGGRVKVRVKTFSFTDLWHLKVKKTIVSLRKSHYKDIPLSKVDIESQTPFWFTLKHHCLEVMHPALFSFKMQVSEQDLDKMLHNPTVTNSLRALRLDLASLGPSLGEQRLQMHEPEVTLQDGLIKVKLNLSTQGADPSTYVYMTVSGQPKLHGADKLYLENVVIDSPDITEPEKFSKFVENLINPLINFNRFDKPNFALRLDEITVKSKTVSVTGRVLLGPHPVKVSPSR